MLRRSWAAVLLVGCSSIPAIRFTGDADVDATLDAAADATLMPDASKDAADAGSEGGIEGGCPGVVPVGAVVCCGLIPCGNVNCSPNACMDCQAKCAVGTLCCPNQGGKATCLNASTCP